VAVLIGSQSSRDYFSDTSCASTIVPLTFWLARDRARGQCGSKCGTTEQIVTRPIGGLHFETLRQPSRILFQFGTDLPDVVALRHDSSSARARACTRRAPATGLARALRRRARLTQSHCLALPFVCRLAPSRLLRVRALFRHPRALSSPALSRNPLPPRAPSAANGVGSQWRQ